MYVSEIKYPFSSKRKRMSKILELENGRRRLIIKGASEIVLESCNQYHSMTKGTIHYLFYLISTFRIDKSNE